jgi:GT2 family glycosyltransferase
MTPPDGPHVRDQVVAGYVHPGVVRAEFCASLLELGMETGYLAGVLARESGPNISGPRNLIVAEFLKGTHPWLLMLDTDMVFTPGDVTKVLAAADPAERPIVGGLCYSQNPDGPPLPTMYELVQRDGESLAFARHRDWPEGSVMRVSATGAAFLLMHRSALHRIEKTSNDAAAPWFRETAVAPMSLMGEDMTFCLRAAAAGIPVHVHTGARIGHMKTTMI